MTDETAPDRGADRCGLHAMLSRAMRVTAILGRSWRSWPALHQLARRRPAGRRRGHLRRQHSGVAEADSPLQRPAGPAEDAPRSGHLVVSFFLLRLILFAGVIYGSLKCFQGSAIALLFGLSLAIVAMMWEALRLLRD